MDQTPLSKVDTDIRNLQKVSRDLIGHATELAASTGLPSSEIDRVMRQTVEQGRWTGESLSSTREYTGVR